MIEVKTKLSNFDLYLRNFANVKKKILYGICSDLQRDIIIESKKKKTGRKYSIILPNGKIKIHIAANDMAGETQAQMTGAENKARYFKVKSPDLAILGVDNKIPYALKNEKRFGAIRQAIQRQHNKIRTDFVSGFNVFFKNK